MTRRSRLQFVLLFAAAVALAALGAVGERDSSLASSAPARSISLLRTTSGDTPLRLRPARAADWGDPNFVPNAEVQTLAEQYRDIFANRLGLSAAEIAGWRTIVAGGTTTPLRSHGAALVGEADVVDPDGTSSEAGRYCRVRVTTAWQSSSIALRRGTIAHEVFHCLQFDIAGYDRTVRSMPLWIREGTADWASLEVVPGAFTSESQLEYSSFVRYFVLCESTPLTARSYDAVGFYGHVDQVYGTPSTWARIKNALTAGDDGTRFDLLGGGLKYFLDTWAARSTNRPQFGLEWETLRPVKPLPQLGCAPEVIKGNSSVKADSFTRGQYLIEGPAPAKKPVLLVSVVGNGRLSDGAFIDSSDLRSRKFCVGPTCKCGGDPPGEPPPFPRLELPALLALSSGPKPTEGQLIYSTGEQCDPDPPPPSPAPAPPPPGAKGGDPGGSGRDGAGNSGGEGADNGRRGGGSAGGARRAGDSPPGGCVGRGCGASVGEPHMFTLDGLYYDFHGAGEFILSRSSRNGLELQVRQEPYSDSKYVAVNTAAAARVGKDRVVVSRGTPPTVRVNGQSVVLSGRTLRLPGGGTIRNQRGQIDVVWPDGSFMRAWSTNPLWLSVLLWPSQEHVGKVRGLLGNLDGRADNDFITRSGKSLPVASVRGRDHLRRGHRLLYRVLGDGWRVRPKESLFDYARGRTTRSYTKRAFPSKVFTTVHLSRRSRQRAEKTCRQAKIQNRRVFQNCVLDVGLTRDSRFATDAALFERTSRKLESARAPKQPATEAAKTDGSWALLTTSRSSGRERHASSLALDQGRVVVADLASDRAAEAVTFTPSSARDVVSPNRQPIASTEAPNVVSAVHLLAGANGGLQALVEGIPRLGVSFASRNRDGRFAAPAVAADNVRATHVGPPVLGPSGQPLWPASYGGNLWVWRGLTGAVGVDLGRSLVGNEGSPSLGRDSAGRYWLTWYQLASRADQSGAYVAQLDPETLRLVGAPERAPASSSSANNNRRAAFACARTCRLVYLQRAGVNTRVVSWAQGEATPRQIAVVKSSTVQYPFAAYATNGRLWTGWWNKVAKRWETTLGDGGGAGGKVLGVGRPASSGDVSAAAAIASRNDLVLVVSWVRGQSSSRFVNVLSSR